MFSVNSYERRILAGAKREYIFRPLLNEKSLKFTINGFLKKEYSDLLLFNICIRKS
jgi:uncharacterized membrane protein